MISIVVRFANDVRRVTATGRSGLESRLPIENALFSISRLPRDFPISFPMIYHAIVKNIYFHSDTKLKFISRILIWRIINLYVSYKVTKQSGEIQIVEPLLATR